MTKKNIVDIHCHILPKLDDGSPNLEESLKLADAAVEDGITHILATPHHLDRKYINHGKAVVEETEKFQKELDKRGIPLTIFPGQEVHANGNLINVYDDLLGVDVNKKYMLLEFPHDDIPLYSKQLIFELRKKGTVPVIVHPERNSKIQNDLNILYEFIERGALAQLTATSYIGGFGKDVQEISRKLLKNKLIQFVASDAHVLRGRNFLLSEALNAIKADFGIAQAELLEKNAEKAVNGLDIVASDYSCPVDKKRKKFFFF